MPPRRTLYHAALVAGMIALPLLTLYLTISVEYFDGALVVPGAEFLDKLWPPRIIDLLAIAGWFAFQAFLMLKLPGRRVQGDPLPDGGRLTYTMNGLYAFLLTLFVAFMLASNRIVPASWLHDRIVQIVGAANLFALFVCVHVFRIGRAQADDAFRAQHPIEAFFLGAARNPRSGEFDWKFFCEARPGMILWVLLNFSCAAAQYERFHEVSNSMILVCVFQAFYVLDYFIFEEAILSTWDIRHEGFGFMLGWGCLVFIPFTFSLQALWLVNHPTQLPTWLAALQILLNFTGYYIFRTSNLQKHRFRKDSTRTIWGRPPEFIATARGTKLLVSGWWGIARHANYLGDLMMGLAWCLTTASTHLLPYFYFIYFVILLVHRERRDNDHCARKYGADWAEYSRRVRWRIVPGLY